jgi:RNA polymerase sigma factor (sigma-70 family)
VIDCRPFALDCSDLNVNAADRLTRCFLAVRDELLRFLTRRASRETAEDILQDVWLNLREHGDSASWREPRAVLFTTAAHLAVDSQRREARAGRIFCLEMATTDVACPRSELEVQVDAAERVEHIAAALEQLPSVCRDAFLLNRLEALTHAQIAARLGVSTKSVQRYIERAVRHCLRNSEP